MLAAACQTAPLHSTGCRTSEEIEAAFQKLQEEMEESIRSRMDDTRRKLFERFDEDVHQRLRIKLADAKAQLDRVGQRFWSLTRYILGDSARFDDDALAFDLHRPSWPNIAAGRYHLISKSQPEPGHDRSEDEGRISIVCRIRLARTLSQMVRRWRLQSPRSSSTLRTILRVFMW
jgi:hypothetical protein